MQITIETLHSLIEKELSKVEENPIFSISLKKTTGNPPVFDLDFDYKTDTGRIFYEKSETIFFCDYENPTLLLEVLKTHIEKVFSEKTDVVFAINA